jgi:hypothetical protein
MTSRKQHKWRRAAPPLIVVAVALAFTAAASAQTTFQADVDANTPPPKVCSNSGFCGSASIAGYGSATFTSNITNVIQVANAPCSPPSGSPALPQGSMNDFTYTMTDTFHFSDGNLVIDESGLACVPGHNESGAHAGGDPRFVSGTWTVDSTSTGQFAGLTGSGTDLAHLAGGSVSGIYSGTLG